MEQALQGIEGIIFELDSVLFDKSDWVLPATEHAAVEMRIDPERAVRIATEYIAKHGGADPQIYNAVLLGCGQFDTAMNIRAFTTLVNQFQPASRSIQLYPGVEETLLRLRDTFRMAVVTDGPPDTQKRKVIALGLNELIGTVIYSDEIEGIKSRLPDPRPLLLAASQMRLRPEKILFVGHNPVKHFQRTREIGFTTMRVLSGEYGRHDYPSEDHRADIDMPSVASLLHLLDMPVASAQQAGDGWGVETSWPAALATQPARPELAAADLPVGTTFEDAAFAALFQMTEPLLLADPVQEKAAPEVPAESSIPAAIPASSPDLADSAVTESAEAIDSRADEREIKISQMLTDNELQPTASSAATPGSGSSSPTSPQVELELPEAEISLESTESTAKESTQAPEAAEEAGNVANPAEEMAADVTSTDPGLAESERADAIPDDPEKLEDDEESGVLDFSTL